MPFCSEKIAKKERFWESAAGLSDDCMTTVILSPAPAACTVAAYFAALTILITSPFFSSWDSLIRILDRASMAYKNPLPISVWTW